MGFESHCGKAYDSVPRQEVWRRMGETGVPEKKAYVMI